MLAFIPLLAGFRPVDALATLIVGYALTGFMEEALWRGLVLRVLRPTGPLPAVLFGSLLFGASHLANVLFRDNVTLVAAQAVGAFCFGVGYAAIALRIGTIWPLMVLHALTDLFAAVGALPKIQILGRPGHRPSRRRGVAAAREPHTAGRPGQADNHGAALDKK